MRVLFLDDNQVRAEQFKAVCPEAVWVSTARDCVDRLSENWDAVYLDHDLDGEIFVDSDRENTGMEVVRYLVAARPRHLMKTRFVVHSANLEAAELMVQTLLDAGYDCRYIPFPSVLAMLAGDG